MKKGPAYAEHMLRFENMYKQYYSLLCAIAYEYFHDRMLAEDTVEEVFLKMWDKKSDFEFISNEKAYLIAAVRNRCVQELRKKTITFQDIEVTADKWHIPWGGNHPLGEILQNEMRSSALKCIDNLPEMCKKVFLMSRNGKTYNEISKELGISVDTVKYHIKRALAKLRQSVDSTSSSNLS